MIFRPSFHKKKQDKFEVRRFPFSLRRERA
jgi:hypothetical protein